MSAPEIIAGQRPDILLLCDHASNAVPPGVDLGIAPALLDKHIAVDIGAAPLTRALAAALGAPAILATVSRLVIDLNRQPDHPGLIPHVSDGHVIPGNAQADRAARIAAFHAPFHRALAAALRRERPVLIAAIHSFTPVLEQGDAVPRPWEAGILYNRDVRAARSAIAHLRGLGIVTGDNAPYSGRVLNGTLNRHAEANGIPSMTIEIRNDLLRDDHGIARWTATLATVLGAVCNTLAQKGPSAT